MPGELVTVDFHLELRGVLMGPATPFDFGPEGWGGLATIAVKSQDVTLDQADGDYPGRDYLASKLLTIPLEWNGGDPAGAMELLATMTAAWAPLTDGTLELHGMLPGWGHFFVVGKPRGLVEDLHRLKSGEVAALATFAALDPTIYFPDGDGS